MMSCCLVCCFFFFKQKTAYEMRISDWSSDVCSSDLSRTLDVVDPCTGVAFTQVPDADAADVERAVAAAKAAFPAWRDLAPGARGDVLRAMAAKVADNAEELCALLVQEDRKSTRLNSSH